MKTITIFCNNAGNRLRQPYTQTVKKLKNIQCFKRTKHGAKAAKNAKKKDTDYSRLTDKETWPKASAGKACITFVRP